MLLPRIIPVLLISQGRLVKTVKFDSPKYIGDPINAARIFSEFEADELMVLDISATSQQQAIDYKLIEKIAKQCRMPICYGGGVKSLKQAEILVELGVEKVAVSSALFENKFIISEISEQIGSQSIVAVLDIIRNNETYSLYSHNAKRRLEVNAFDFCDNLIKEKVGEIVFNCIHRDGTWLGLDEKLISDFYPRLSVPVTFIGGANSYDNINDVLQRHGRFGVGAGSLFVYRDDNKAVLLGYPEKNKNLWKF